MLRKTLKVGTVFALSAMASMTTLSHFHDSFEEAQHKTLVRCAQWSDSSARFCRTMAVALTVKGEEMLLDASRDYLFAQESEEVFGERVRRMHKRNAKRVLDILLANGGVYIKAGQAASTMLRGVLPDEYIDELSSLQSRVPSIDFEQVSRTFLHTFGERVDDIFEQFDREPVAAASLAQVHRAVMRDGTVVAVKCQYPTVRRYLHGDLATCKTILRLYWSDMTEEVRESNLKMLDRVIDELDFRLEAQNSVRAKRELADVKHLYIPRVIEPYAGKHVVLTEYIDNAVTLSNAEGLRRLGIDRALAARVLCETFLKQIFVHGFVVCSIAKHRSHSNGTRFAYIIACD
jgi:aarF domain-containing kinase